MPQKALAEEYKAHLRSLSGASFKPGTQALRMHQKLTRQEITQQMLIARETWMRTLGPNRSSGRGDTPTSPRLSCTPSEAAYNQKMLRSSQSSSGNHEPQGRLELWASIRRVPLVHLEKMLK